MRKYRAVILGCGGRSAWHVRAYQAVEKGEVVACCDRNPENLEKFCREFGLKGYNDFEEMIQKEKPHLVHLVTSPKTRVEQMTMVEEMGVPLCLVEKPIALEVRDWKALKALASRAKTKFGVGAQFRYHSVLQRCREVLLSGEMGQPLFVDSSAGGNICDQGVHVLDWAMALMGDPTVVRVFGAASGVEGMHDPVHPSPSNTIAQLKFANGVYGAWNLGSTARRVVDDPLYWKHCRVAVYAEKGHVLYEEFGRWEIVSLVRQEYGKITGREDWVKGNDAAQACLTNAMFDWLEDDSRLPGTHLERALAQWNVILGLYASAVSRQPIEIPFDPPESLWEELVHALSGGQAK